MDTARTAPSRPGPRDLFLAFLSVGLSGFGGVLPFARRALVEGRGWLNEVEFAETLSLCQTLPGPNIVNLSVVVGSRFAGVSGAVAALAGLILAPVAVILIIATLWQRFGATGHLAGAIRGMSAAASGLAGATAFKMARPVLAAAPWRAGLVMAAGFIGLGVLRLPLLSVLLTLAPISVALAWRWRA